MEAAVDLSFLFGFTKERGRKPTVGLTPPVSVSSRRLMESGCYDSQHPESRMRVWGISIVGVRMGSERKDRNSWSIFFPEHPSPVRADGTRLQFSTSVKCFYLFPYLASL